MYKVLLVDDESIIIDSISSLIDWAGHGLVLAGSAQNGIEAYDLIKKIQPDIVITDIKMPGMNGLDLIARVREELPETVFLILSGYGEFDFASKAIQYGVKHYLLKPCDEAEVVPVLVKIKDELDLKRSKDNFVKEINHNIRKVLPQVKEQFLRDFVTTSIYNENDTDFFLRLFNIKGCSFKLVLFRIGTKSDFLERFALKNISEEIIGSERVYLGTIIEEEVLLLIQPVKDDELVELLEEVRNTFISYYNMDLSAAVSRKDSFKNIPPMYRETRESLKYAFYLGDGSIITNSDAGFISDNRNYSQDSDFGDITSFVKAGDMENVRRELNCFFDRIESEKHDISMAKSYSMELYLSVARQCRPELMNEYVRGVVKIQEMNTLKQIRDFINSTACRITQMHYENTVKKHNIVIDTVIKCINENIQNPDLSLTWIAKEVLYMNENYLGKLFLKEMNEKFSQYVMRVRIEKAKELIESPNNYKIYEVSEMTGFADYTQYFSQVFKKYTGVTPSDYKKTQ